MTVIEVELEEETVAGVTPTHGVAWPQSPANHTATLEPKFVPVIVTVVPTDPILGLKSAIAGAMTVKLLLLFVETMPPDRVTSICPVRAADGTVTVIDVELEDVTVAGDVPTHGLGLLQTPANDTLGFEPKFVPVIVTDVPMGPLWGLKSVMVGV